MPCVGRIHGPSRGMVRSPPSRVTWARAPTCEREGDHLTTETEPTLRLSFRGRRGNQQPKQDDPSIQPGPVLLHRTRADNWESTTSKSPTHPLTPVLHGADMCPWAHARTPRGTPGPGREGGFRPGASRRIGRLKLAKINVLTALKVAPHLDRNVLNAYC